MAGRQLPVGRRLGALGVFYYSDVLAVAATGVTNPLLLVPLVATGFLGGCSVGANGAPRADLAAAPIGTIPAPIAGCGRLGLSSR
jgi:hypothetical protein